VGDIIPTQWFYSNRIFYFATTICGQNQSAEVASSTLGFEDRLEGAANFSPRKERITIGL